MKKLLSPLIFLFAFFLFSAPTTHAGDCKTRDAVNQNAVITSAVFVRSDCPTGDIIGTVPGGEVVRILEVDRFNEFYLIQTSVGTGFVFRSFLKNIVENNTIAAPIPVPIQYYDNSIFPDLNPNHIYYDQIADVTNKGIVSGTQEGLILADNLILRAQLAKILVEATTTDEEIAAAILPTNRYSDIETDGWYKNYLEIAWQKKIMQGDNNKQATVRPDDPAAGSEVAKMLAIAFKLDIPAKLPNQQWFEPYMNKLKEMQVLPFTSPTHQVTRGEMMYMVSKILETK